MFKLLLMNTNNTKDALHFGEKAFMIFLENQMKSDFLQAYEFIISIVSRGETSTSDRINSFMPVPVFYAIARKTRSELINSIVDTKLDFLKLFEEEGNLIKRNKEISKNIQENLDIAINIISRLEDSYTELELYDYYINKPFDLPDLIDEVAQANILPFKKNQLSVTLDRPSELSPLIGNRESLRVFFELCFRNYAEILPKGGTVIIMAREIKKDIVVKFLGITSERKYIDRRFSYSKNKDVTFFRVIISDSKKVGNIYKSRKISLSNKAFYNKLKLVNNVLCSTYENVHNPPEARRDRDGNLTVSLPTIHYLEQIEG